MLHKMVTEDLVLSLPDAQGLKVEAAEVDGGADTSAPTQTDGASAAFFAQLQSQLQNLSENEGLLIFYRSQFIQMLKVLLGKVKAKAWTKRHLMDIAKEMYLNRHGFFNASQEDELSTILDESSSQLAVLTSRFVLISEHQQAVSVRDGNTVSTPLQAKHEVSDNREWRLAGDGMDKWANRQFTH